MSRRHRFLPSIRLVGVACLGGLLALGSLTSSTAPSVVSGAEREQLLDEREGFGRAAGEGSTAWPVVVVTTLRDAGPGSLRDAVGRSGSWIRFASGLRGTIELTRPLAVRGDLVVDGRGADITLHADASTDLIRIHEVDNVVLTNIRFSGGEDAIQVFQGATDIWIHHVTATAAADEIVSMTGDGRRPDRITVSWSRFEDAGKVMLLGASEREAAHAPDRVTLHHNVFANSSDRQPLIRFARVHFYNNHVIAWGEDGSGQAVRVGAGGQLASDGNVFDDRFGRPAVIPEDLGTRGYVRSTGDVITGRTSIVERSPQAVFDPRDHYAFVLDEAGESLRVALAEGAGWRAAP
ncbi:MAG TPA: hypothetical protein VK906_00960 [Egicoccus sp.]|nr:hypothetical protein [Egicoccus sp.]HSK21708.1 hypothetical protein [Egicoccus sp.]